MNTCQTCHWFEASPAALEAGLPGLAALSSAYASLRSDDGFCLQYDRHVHARAGCGSYRGEMASGESLLS